MTHNKDIYITADREGDPLVADNKAIKSYLATAHAYRASDHGGDRLRVHLVLRSQTLANAMRRLPLEQDLSENVELYSYTMEDLWAMEALGLVGSIGVRLDREPIGFSSDKIVHFALFGATDFAQSLIINTALIAHYPNFCRDHTLRTRITWVGDKYEDFVAFQQQYRVLLDNSWRRNIYIKNADLQIEELPPLYAIHRREFVDIEWEFVESTPFSDIITYKIKKWAEDENQLLTLAYCYNDNKRNLENAMALPKEVLNKVPVLVKQSDDTTIKVLSQSNVFSNLIPIGIHSGHMCMKNFIHMAQCVNYAYCKMRTSTQEEQQSGAGEMVVATELPCIEELQRLWNNSLLTTPKRWSNIYCAFTISTKMHSLGFSMNDWRQLIAIRDCDVQILAEVEHNRWSIEELILGYLPTTDEEHQEILSDMSKRMILKRQFKHDDLRHYSELGVDESGLSVKRYDVGLIRSLSLIAHSYYKEIANDE